MKNNEILYKNDIIKVHTNKGEEIEWKKKTISITAEITR